MPEIAMHGTNRPRGRRPLIWRAAPLFFAVIAACAFGLGWARSQADKAPLAQLISTAAVQTAVVEPRPIELTRIGLGTVTAWNTATITPQISGEVIDLPFHEGETVAKGN